MSFLRPSTSGGLDRQGGNNSFDKRMSKDDSFLQVRRTGTASAKRISRDDSYIRDRMATMSQFHIPNAASTAMPAHSPATYQKAWTPVHRLDTPESTTSGDIPIGMALGSPAHASFDMSRWQAQFPPASPQTTDLSSVPSPAMSGTDGSLQRKKTGRKKLFGLFGGGKKNAGDEGSRGGLLNLNRSSAASTVSVSTKMPKTPTRSHTQSDMLARHKPMMMRSNTTPHDQQATPRTLVSFQRESNENQGRAMPAIPPIPRLEVRIPDTKMERYSVMFSDLLKDNTNKDKDKEPAASLLARRQATLERLKTINGSNGGFSLEPVPEVERARPRRATSPQPQAVSFPQPAPTFAVTPAQNSPRLSVFPMPPTGRPGLNTNTSATQSRPARSNTSPGRLPSPTHAVFDRRTKAPPSNRGTPNLEVYNPFEMNPPESSKPTYRDQAPIYPTDTSFQFGPEQSGLILDSPTSIESLEEILISQPFKPTLHEPQWQMISPVTTNASSVTTASSSGRRGRSPSATSASTHTTKPSSDLDTADAALQNAVEVSIARQISISHQQRNLLRPLNTRRAPVETTRSALPGNAGSVAMGGVRSPLGVMVVKTPSPSRLGRDEPIRETKSSTPTLVHRRGSPVDPQNRKSSWVVLESD